VKKEIFMVSCPKCSINNTLDSLFCRKCGETLPTDLIAGEQVKLKELVTQGMESFQNGNSDEAMAIAEHAILTNPSYAEAYALKGMVHERRAQYAEALDSFETVVALNPDSTLDKIKLNQLRNAFAQRQALPAEPDKKTAIIMSIAACLLVAAVSFGVYRMASGSKSTQVNTSGSGNVVQNDSRFGATGADMMGKTVPNPTGEPGAGSLAPDDVQPVGGNSAGSQNFPSVASNSGDSSSVDSLSGPIRRNMENNYNGGTGGDRPIRSSSNNSDTTNPSGRQIPSIPPVEPGGGTSTRQVRTSGGSDPDPSPSPNTKRVDGPGEINIEVMGGTSDNQGRKALENAGSIRMQGGDPDGASKAFQQAAQSSGASGKTFQRAGQSLMRSGKKSEAINAFEKAVSAYEKELSSGKGDKSTIQAGLNSCKQALKSLKSN